MDRTNEIIINQRAKKLFIILDNNNASKAMRESGYTSYPNSLNIVKQFVIDGYYYVQNKKYIRTGKGIELAKKLEGIEDGR